MTRKSMLEIDWFARSNVLAIADVVYVDGVGLCSHQPDGSCKGHRVLDMRGNIYVVETDKLFLASPEERNEYWDALEELEEK